MNSNSSSKKRTYGLDVYRAIAIILVVHGHGKYMLKGTTFENFPWVKLVDGVELFFVLSGFLIGGILIKIIDQNNYSLNFYQIFNFWKRRWFRTLPNYYLVLGLYLLFISLGIVGGNLEHFNFKFLVFLQNFASPFYHFFWESWSLTIEEWFYIFLPLTLWGCLKIWPSRKGLLTAILILLVCPLLYRISQSGIQVDSFGWDTKFRKIVLMRLDTIVYGVLMAYAKFYYQDFWKKYATQLFVIGFLYMMVIPFIPRESNDFFNKTFYFNLTSIAAMCLLPFADQYKSFKTSFGKMMTHISLISYSMYLINLCLVVGFINKHFPIVNASDGSIKYIVYWGATLFFSTIIYKYFEKPVMDLRDRF